MSRDLKEELAALSTMSAAQLQEQWSRIFREPSPPLTPDLLARGIAYRLQEKVHGGLSKSALREIERLQKQYERTGEVVSEPCATMKPGTRLVREWGAKQHQVLILDDGYVYQDRRYNSLSQIAQEITGAKWSGPRFFGLRRGTQGKSKSAGEGANG
jgi:hypothetical protein